MRLTLVEQPVHELTDQHLAILDFETQKPLWKYAGARNAAIFEELGLTPPATPRSSTGSSATPAP